MFSSATINTPIIVNMTPAIIGLLNNSYFLMSRREKRIENTSLEDSKGIAIDTGMNASAKYLARWAVLTSNPLEKKYFTSASFNCLSSFTFSVSNIIGTYTSRANKYDTNGPTIGVPPDFRPNRIRGAEDPKESPAPTPHNIPFLNWCC